MFKSWVWSAVCVGLVACWAAGACADEAAQGGQRFTVRVIDGWSQEPMPGVEVHFTGSWGTRAERTDDRGRASVPIPPGTPELTVWASQEGWATTQVVWEGLDADAGRGLPTEVFDLVMPEGVPIGGVVRDTEGRPVADARVGLSVRTEDAGFGEPFNHIGRLELTTDQDGRWEYAGAPEDLSGLKIWIRHDGYLEPDDDAFDPPDEALREFTAELILDRGATVGGSVVDAEGRPVAGARVSAIKHEEDRYDGMIYAWRGDGVTTAADGRFTVGKLEPKPGTFSVIVQHEAFAPVKHDLTLDGEHADAGELTLEAGTRLHGRVVDADGQPIPDVEIELHTWNKVRGIEWATRTDDDGRWSWGHAPAGPVTLDFAGVGYMGLGDQALQPQEAAYEHTLQRHVVITGTVVDAATGQPIPEFSVTPGYLWNEFDPDNAQRSEWRKEAFEGGEFTWSFDDPDDSKQLLFVTAEGYRGARSPAYDTQGDEREHAWEVRLEVDQGLPGRVVDAEGRPVAGVEVMAYTESIRGQFSNGEFESHNYSQDEEDAFKPAVTDAEGRFTLPTPDEKYLVLAWSDAGGVNATQEDFEKSSDVTLAPWGRIEGRVRRGTQAVPNAQVQAAHDFSGDWDPHALYINFNYETRADAGGNFVLERVWPGRVQLGRIDDEQERWQFDFSTSVPVRAGETASAQIGGKGRPVIGRIRLPDDLPATDEDFGSMPYIYTVPREVERPRAERRGLFSRLGFGDPGPQAPPVRNPRHFELSLDDEGRFRLDDVPAGAYRLQHNVYGPKPGTDGDNWDNITEFATVNFYFEIDRIEGGVSDEPQDLGDIPAEVHPQRYAPADAESDAGSEDEAVSEAEPAEAAEAIAE